MPWPIASHPYLAWVWAFVFQGGLCGPSTPTRVQLQCMLMNSADAYASAFCLVCRWSLIALYLDCTHRRNHNIFVLLSRIELWIPIRCIWLVYYCSLTRQNFEVSSRNFPFMITISHATHFSSDLIRRTIHIARGANLGYKTLAINQTFTYLLM